MSRQLIAATAATTAILLALSTPALAQPAADAAPPQADPLEQATEALGVLDSELLALRKEIDASEGDNRLVAEEQAADKAAEWRDALGKLVSTLAGKDAPTGPAADLARATVTRLLAREAARLVREVRVIERRITRQNAVRKRKKGEALLELQEELDASNARLDAALDELVTNTGRRESLAIDAAAEAEFLREALTERSERLVSRLDVAAGQADALRNRPAATDDEKAAVKADAERLKKQVELTTESLKATVELMKKRELDTAALQQLLIERTGDITTDILDADVALGLAQKWFRNAKDWVLKNGPTWIFKAVLIAVVLLLFWLLAALARAIARLALKRSEASVLLVEFLVSMAGKIVFFVGIVIALSQLGFGLGPMLAGLGVAGFVIGFALQDTLSNFASGMMILLYRPFDVGDQIEAGGVVGLVAEMTLVSTTVRTLDNQRIVVPNNKIWGDVIKNVFAEDNRRVDMVFGIGYGDDIDRAEAVLAEIVEGTEGVLAEPAPVIALHNLGDSSVDFIVRPWARSEDYWPVYWAITREVKRRFDAEGISIPFPQRDVHVYNNAAA